MVTLLRSFLAATIAISALSLAGCEVKVDDDADVAPARPAGGKLDVDVDVGRE
jgi:hypothetical protein